MTTHKPPLSNGILDSRGRQTPLALVVEWGSESLRVVCPYCLRCRRHGLGPSPLTGQTRAAHCGLRSANYQLCYPFEEQSQAQYSYRIDKARGLFVTVGIALPSDNEVEESEDEEDEEVDEEGEDEGEEADEADRGCPEPTSRAGRQQPRSATNARGPGRAAWHRRCRALEPHSFDKIWVDLMQDANYRQTLFHSHCTLNNFHGVASLLERYKDDPFVSWRNKDGVNCIALAAVEGHDTMIQFLHDKGGDLNNADRRGRTPLMEAALWGRLKVVIFLLELGADPCAKDRKGRGAYFCSRPSRRTARMREGFSHYQESSEAELNRRIIAIKLQAFTTSFQPPSSRLFLPQISSTSHSSAVLSLV